MAVLGHDPWTMRNIEPAKWLDWGALLLVVPGALVVAGLWPERAGLGFVAAAIGVIPVAARMHRAGRVLAGGLPPRLEAAASSLLDLLPALTLGAGALLDDQLDLARSMVVGLVGFVVIFMPGIDLLLGAERGSRPPWAGFLGVGVAGLVLPRLVHPEGLPPREISVAVGLAMLGLAAHVAWTAPWSDPVGLRARSARARAVRAAWIFLLSWIVLGALAFLVGSLAEDASVALGAGPVALGAVLLGASLGLAMGLTRSPARPVEPLTVWLLAPALAAMAHPLSETRFVGFDYTRPEAVALVAAALWVGAPGRGPMAAARVGSWIVLVAALWFAGY